MSRKNKNRLLLFLVFTVTVILFQNCGGDGFKSTTAGSGSASLPSIDNTNNGSGGTPPPSQIPPPPPPSANPVDRLDPQCFMNPDFDSCIFWKNPVAQKGSALSSTTSLSELMNYQTYAVDLRGLDGSGFLQNSSLRISSYTQVRAQSPWKYSLETDPAQKAGQVMAYYWGQRVLELARDLQAPIALSGRAVNLVTEAPVNGWSATTNSVYLSKSASQANLALDASIIVHLLAEANLYHAAGVGFYDLNQDIEHVDCGRPEGPVYEKDCCKSKLGCSKALSSGQADYVVAILFPQANAFGEFVQNLVTGFQACGLSRNPNLNVNLTADAAYAQCQNIGMAGQVYSMGVVYTSIWWEVRKKASSPEEIDRIYFNHLARLRSSDNFLTALNTIKGVDQDLYQGKYSALFDTEFRRRGL